MENILRETLRNYLRKKEIYLNNSNNNNNFDNSSVSFELLSTRKITIKMVTTQVEEMTTDAKISINERKRQRDDSSDEEMALPDGTIVSKKKNKKLDKETTAKLSKLENESVYGDNVNVNNRNNTIESNKHQSLFSQFLYALKNSSTNKKNLNLNDNEIDEICESFTNKKNMSALVGVAAGICELRFQDVKNRLLIDRRKKDKVRETDLNTIARINTLLQPTPIQINDDINEDLFSDEKQVESTSALVNLQSLDKVNLRNCRLNLVPKAMYNQTSFGVRAAIALFIIHEPRGDVINNMIEAIYCNEFSTVGDIVEYLRGKTLNDVASDLKIRISKDTRKFTTNTSKDEPFVEINDNMPETQFAKLIKSVLFLSDIFKDKIYAGMAYEMNYPIYLYIIKKIQFDSRAVYEPFMVRHVKVQSEISLRELKDQFSINKNILSDKIDELIQNEHEQNKYRKNNKIFDENIEYEIFEYPEDFSQKLENKTEICNGKAYSVTLLNRCLYNVMADDMLKMSWSEKLEAVKGILKYPTIHINKVSGSVLNNYSTKCTVAYAYFDGDSLVHKIHSFKAKKEQEQIL